MRAFRDAIESRDVEGAVALMADEVSFRSPVVHKPYEGREDVATVLHAVVRVLQDFRYEREIGAEDSRDQALVFRARVADRELEGCDLIHTDVDGRIDELVVMIRPLSGLLAAAEVMKAELERAGHA